MSAEETISEIEITPEMEEELAAMGPGDEDGDDE